MQELVDNKTAPFSVHGVYTCNKNVLLGCIHLLCTSAYLLKQNLCCYFLLLKKDKFLKVLLHSDILKLLFTP